MQRLLALIAVGIFVSACSTTAEQSASTTPAAAPPAEAQPAQKTPPPETEAQRQERLINELSAKSIYFGSAEYALKPEYKDLLKQVYEFMNSAPQVSLTLAGNTDSRRGANKALGQKRADAVKRALKQLGLADNRMKAISQGNTKPRASCHEKKCLAENRRVDLVFHTAQAAK